MHDHTRRLPLALFLLLCGFYLLTMSGHTYSSDEETMYAVTRALVTSGEVAVQALDGAPVSALRPGLDGLRYSPYGILPSLLALPLYALGSLAAPLGPAALDYTTRLAVTTLNAPVSAATAALLAAWALRLGASRVWAAALALLYGLCTFAWPYARTFFSEPLAGLLILVAAERVFNAKCKMQHAKGGGKALGSVRHDLFLSGLACGLLLTTRIAAGVVVPVIGLYLLWVCRQVVGRAQARHFACCMLHFALGLLPGLALLAWYNLARFGTPLASGYASEAGLFTTPLAEGLFGLLFSPGKSVLLFAPPLLLALPGGVLLWRRGERGLVLLCLGLFFSHLLLYASWGEWQGGGVWGPRFLLPVIAPLLLLGAGVAPFTGTTNRNDEDRKSPEGTGVRQNLRGLHGFYQTMGVRVIVVCFVALVGFIGNLGGVLLNFGTYVVAREPADKLYSLAGSPLVGHWATLLDRWGRYTVPPPVCRLGGGFYPTEDAGGAALPRRSGARGELSCVVDEPARLRFSLDDRRPPGAPPSELRLLLEDRALGPPGGGELRSYSLLLPAGETRVAIVAVPWNPFAVGFSERDDQLGPQLGELRGLTASGAALTVVDTAVAPLPEQPRPRWAWYYDPPNQHLVDHWAWYLPRSELAGPAVWFAAGLILLAGGGCLAAGVWRLRTVAG